MLIAQMGPLFFQMGSLFAQNPFNSTPYPGYFFTLPSQTLFRDK